LLGSLELIFEVGNEGAGHLVCNGRIGLPLDQGFHEDCPDFLKDLFEEVGSLIALLVDVLLQFQEFKGKQCFLVYIRG
jgi:hypothetical protein